jgi:autotransporter-associated beta strand protein
MKPSLWILFLTSLASALGAEFHVAPTGSDTNPGSSTEPFATPARALAAMREWKGSHPAEANRILLHGGTYRLEQPLVLTPGDSGTAEAPLVIEAAAGEIPVITSAHAITDWRTAAPTTPGLQAVAVGHVLEADIPTGWRFHYLYLGGQTQRVAAMNKTDDWHQWPKPVAVGSVGPGGQPLTLPPGQLDGLPSNGDLEMNLMPVQYWNTLSVIRDINPATNSCRRHSKNPTTFWLNQFDQGKGQYNLQNALKFLTQPGEWCVDSTAGRVLFWPPDGSLAGKAVEAPRLQRLMELQGDPEGASVVSHVEIRGITFTCTDRLPEDEWPDPWVKRQAELPDAMLHLEGVADCVIEGNRFTYSGSYGIALENYAQRVRVTRNEIAHPGCGGVLLQGFGPGTTDVNRDNLIRRNYIHHTGNGGYLHSAAVTLYQSGHNDIALNWIDTVPYVGIQIAGAGFGEYGPGRVQGAWDSYGNYDAMYRTRWSELPSGTNSTFTRDSFKPYLHSRGNRISNNILTGFLTRMSDGGGLYSWGCGNDNIWENNLLRRDFTNPGEQWCFALYMDDYVDAATLSGNVCWHTSTNTTINKGTNIWTSNTVTPAKPGNYDTRLQQIAALAACEGGWIDSPSTVVLSTAAADPSPENGQHHVGLQPLLRWTPISACHRQDVYFGTDSIAVADATLISPEYMGRQDGAFFPLPVELPSNTKLYWRVDQVNSEGIVIRGPTWSFTTAAETLHADLALHLSLDARHTVAPMVHDLAGPPYQDAIQQNSPVQTAGIAGEALTFNGTSQSLQTPALNLKSSNATIAAWIKRSGNQINYSGVAYCRGGSTVSGLNFTTGNQLGYTWNNDSGSVNFNSGLVPPDGQWALVALVVAPDRATLWLGTADGSLRSASNIIPHAVQTFDAPLYVASDPLGGRFFKGTMDELRVWRRSLGTDEIASLLASGRAGISTAPGSPRDFTWTSANQSGSWTSATNWNGSAIAIGSGNVADLSTLALAANASVSLDAVRVIGGLKFGDMASVPHDWTLDGGSGGPALTLDGIAPFIQVNQATAFVKAPLAGSKGLTKTGPGILELTANCEVSGNVTVNEGTLRLTLANPPPVAPISGAAIWLDAADTATLHADASNHIIAWDNKGTSGGSLTQSEPARQPALTSGMVRFNGGQVLTNAVNYSNTGREIHVFIAAHRDSQALNSGIISLRSSAVAADWNNAASIILGDRGSYSLPNTLSATRNSSDQPLVSLPGTTGNGSTFVANFLNKSDGTAASWLNGAGPRTATCSGSFAIDRVAIGGRLTSATPATTSGYWNGRIGEILIYNRALSEADRMTTEAYLMAKWAVGLSTGGRLPANAPVTILSGATLAGDGNASGTVTVTSGGILRPGGRATLGKLATGSLTLGGTLVCRLSGTDCDQVLVSGDLTLLPGASIDLTNLTPAANTGIYSLATCTGAINGPLPTVTGLPPSYELDASVPGQLRLVSPYLTWAASHNLTGNSVDTDPDGDGSSCLLEFATGGSPHDPTRNGLRYADVQYLGGERALIFTIATRSGAVFSTAPNGTCESTIDGIGYRVEGTTDLAHWNLPILKISTPSGLPEAPTGYENHTFRTSAAVDSRTQAFIRLSVSIP